MYFRIIDITGHPLSIEYGRKIFRKTNISNLLIRTLGIRNVSFPGIFRTYLTDGPLPLTEPDWTSF